MQNRFGLKDFVMLVLLLAVLCMVLLAMYQEDRRWEQIRRLSASVDSQVQILARIERSLAGGLVVKGAGSAADTAPTRDGSWARPGVAVTVPRSFQDYVSDPTAKPGFKEGGTFTEIFEGQAPKITPYLYSDVYGQRIVDEVVCECLGAYDPATLELRGQLAEAWQYDPAGLWLRVKIHDQACFSDGQPVTAEDCKFTIDFVFNSEHETERFRSTMDNIKAVRVIAPKVVEYEFKEPRFNSQLQALRHVILPKHFYEKFTPSQINQSTGLIMGSGPYKLQLLDVDRQWAPPQPMVFVRNEQYWGRRPPIDTLRFVAVSDNIARLIAFENGEGDMIRATPEQYARKSEDPGFVERSHTLAWTNMRSGYSFIAWNCGPRNEKLTPFHDRRVRLAMTHLLDRDRINRDFYEGLADIAHGPFNARTRQANPNPIPYEMDLEKSRTLLTEAGWIDRDDDGLLENDRGDEFVFEYTYSTGSAVAEKVGKYLADQCAKVGIKCNLRVTDWSVLDTIQNNRDFDALTLAWSWASPESDPNQVWHSSAILNQGDNWMQWSNPEADRLIEAARRETNEEKRMKLWHELDRIIQEEQPYTFLLAIPWIRFVDRRIDNVHPYNVGLDKREMFVP